MARNPSSMFGESDSYEGCRRRTQITLGTCQVLHTRKGQAAVLTYDNPHKYIKKELTIASSFLILNYGFIC